MVGTTTVPTDQIAATVAAYVAPQVASWGTSVGAIRGPSACGLTRTTRGPSTSSRRAGYFPGEPSAGGGAPESTIETAFLRGEFYRRQGVWKFRAIGQGYRSGLEFASPSPANCPRTHRY